MQSDKVIFEVKLLFMMHIIHDVLFGVRMVNNAWIILVNLKESFPLGNSISACIHVFSYSSSVRVSQKSITLNFLIQIHSISIRNTFIPFLLYRDLHVKFVFHEIAKTQCF